PMPSSLQNFRVGWSSTPTVTSPAAAPTGTCTSHPAGHNRTVAAADDDRPKAGGEVHLTTVLRENWRQLYRGRLERRHAATPRLVPQPRRQPGGRSPSRDPEDEGGCQDRHRNARGCGKRRQSSGRPAPNTVQDRARDPGGGAGSCAPLESHVAKCCFGEGRAIAWITLDHVESYSESA